MKVFIIVLAVLVVLFLAFQIFITMSTNKTEKQAYEVIHSTKGFEIRFYPSATMASIVSSAKSHKELGNSGFRQLAGYIFGGNDTGQKIAMTT
ncbi:MAG: heme-binding protein, partial [Saprospiraceae bacterium]|nr:heme-binding protein [Saprospiraceae bacterium]